MDEMGTSREEAFMLQHINRSVSSSQRELRTRVREEQVALHPIRRDSSRKASVSPTGEHRLHHLQRYESVPHQDQNL